MKRTPTVLALAIVVIAIVLYTLVISWHYDIRIARLETENQNLKEFFRTEIEERQISAAHLAQLRNQVSRVEGACFGVISIKPAQQRKESKK